MKRLSDSVLLILRISLPKLQREVSDKVRETRFDSHLVGPIAFFSGRFSVPAIVDRATASGMVVKGGVKESCSSNRHVQPRAVRKVFAAAA